MEILSIDIERAERSKSFCGTLNYNSEDIGDGHLLWTVECVSDAKINVAFVQGSQEDWVKTAETYAHDFSDNIILTIARTQPLPSLAANLTHFI